MTFNIQIRGRRTFYRILIFKRWVVVLRLIRAVNLPNLWAVAILKLSLQVVSFVRSIAFQPVRVIHPGLFHETLEPPLLVVQHVDNI